MISLTLLQRRSGLPTQQSALTALWGLVCRTLGIAFTPRSMFFCMVWSCCHGDPRIGRLKKKRGDVCMEGVREKEKGAPLACVQTDGLTGAWQHCVCACLCVSARVCVCVHAYGCAWVDLIKRACHAMSCNCIIVVSNIVSQLSHVIFSCQLCTCCTRRIVCPPAHVFLFFSTYLSCSFIEAAVVVFLKVHYVNWRCPKTHCINPPCKITTLYHTGRENVASYLL